MPLVKLRDKCRKFVCCWFACDLILSPSSLGALLLITAKLLSQ